MKKFLVTVIVFLAAGTVVPTAQAIIPVLDLTTLSASGNIGGVTFTQDGQSPFGSGVSQDFLRLGTGSTNVETGFNTDARPLGPDLADVNSSLTFTHSLRVSDLLDVGGSYVFRLDINQARSSPLLSLDMFHIWTASTGDINALSDLTAQHSVYDMGNYAVYLNYALEPGSGTSDLDILVPVAMFAGHTSDYVYTDVTFGATGGDYAANDGGEQLSAITGTTVIPVPEASSLALATFGLGLIGIGVHRRKRPA